MVCEWKWCRRCGESGWTGFRLCRRHDNGLLDWIDRLQRKGTPVTGNQAMQFLLCSTKKKRGSKA